MEEFGDGGGDDAELPEYPYTNAALTLQREKEERYMQKDQQKQPSSTEAGSNGSRLRRVMSFVRGTDS